MAQSLIISVDDFRELTGMGDAVSSERITAMLVSATDTYCQRILGTALTQKLITDYNTDELAGDYLELWDSAKASVKKMVIWQAYVHNMNALVWTVGNGRFVKGSTEDGEAVDSSDVAVLKREKMAMLVDYENRVKTYLSQNQSSFPELEDTTPEYLQENITKGTTSQGTDYLDTLKYNDL